MERVQAAFACQQNPSSTQAQIKEANVWLEQFQGTTEAWQVADQLLALDAAGNGLLTAAQIFAAQTMRAKIQYDFAERFWFGDAGLGDDARVFVHIADEPGHGYMYNNFGMHPSCKPIRCL